jgi:hypothetical protein
VLGERGGKVLTVSTERQGGVCVLQLATEPVAPSWATDLPTASPVDPEDGLGLNACKAILQEHGGRVSRERHENGAILLRVELSAADTVATISKEITVPALQQSRPYA